MQVATIVYLEASVLREIMTSCEREKISLSTYVSRSLRDSLPKIEESLRGDNLNPANEARAADKQARVAKARERILALEPGSVRSRIELRRLTGCGVNACDQALVNLVEEGRLMVESGKYTVTVST